jgi:hypothetical protein
MKPSFRMFPLVAAAVLFLTIAPCPPLRAQNSTDFTIDARSPEVSRFKVGDIIKFDGSVVVVDVTQLGLPATAKIDAFSYGKDKLVPFGPGFFVALDFSVSRHTLGAGGIVSTQVRLDSAAGDKFRMYILRSGRSIGPFLESNADKHGLTKPGPIQSNIDGLSYVTGPRKPIFWSVDVPTAQALGLDPATIYVTMDPGVTPFTVYRTAAQMQLQGQDIDGLAVADAGVIGQFDGADVIYISLTPSLLRQRYCGAPPAVLDCVVQIEPPRGPGLNPPGRMVVSNTQLDLEGPPPTTGELDAFTGVDPGPCLDSLPPRRRQQQPREAAAEEGRALSGCIARFNARAVQRK